MKFYEASFTKNIDGTLSMNTPAQNDRITIEIFHASRGGRAATAEEVKKANIRIIGNGFTPWICKDGSLRAIKSSIE